MRNAASQWLVTATVLLVCAGCSSGENHILNVDNAAPHFQLELLPESFVGGAHIQTSQLEVSRVPGGFNVLIGVNGAQDLKALYVKLLYDPSQLAPVSAKATNLLGGADKLLELSLLKQPGIVTHGQVLCNLDTQPGFSGSGHLLAVCFKQRPFGLTSSSRGASLAPASDASRTTISLNIENSTLSWRYFNQGDYDQNGIVGITDLTPLGLHFGEAGPFDVDTIGGVIDGDANGGIGLTDLVPIGANFSRRVRGYRVYASPEASDYPASNSANSTIAWSAEVNSAAGNPAIERLSYSLVLAAVVDDSFYWVRPYDGDALDPAASEGTPSNMLDAGALLNEAPVADLVAHPAMGLAPLPVQLYAGGSADPDGTIVQYEWDFDGDGTFDETGYQEFTSHIFDTEGMYIVSLRVTDDDGATATDGNLIVVNEPAGWRLGLVARDLPLDNGFAAAIVDAKPAVAFSSYGELRYCSATDAVAGAWANPTAVATNPVSEGSLSLVEIGGRPAIVYAEENSQGPFIVRAADAAGTAWAVPLAIANPELTDLFRTQIILAANGWPVVAASTISAGAHSIQIMLAADINGLIWGAPGVADGGAAGFLTPALALVNDLPAMAYMDADAAAIYSLSSGLPAGSNWVDETEIDPGIYSGLSLAEINGRPAVSFVEAPPHLEYIRADDAAGSAWSNFTQPDPEADLRFDTALASNAGVPVIAYVTVAAGGTDDELRFVRGLDEDGAAWALPEVIGVFDRVGLIRILELNDGRPSLIFQVLYDVLDPGLNGDALYFAVPE